MPRNYYIVNRNRKPPITGTPPGDFTGFRTGGITPAGALTRVLGGPPPPQNFVITKSGIIAPASALSRTLIAPPPVGGSHEPAGFRRIVEYAFSDDPQTSTLDCTTAGMLAGSRNIGPNAGGITRYTDASAPKSPSAGWQWAFNTGLTVGQSINGVQFWEACSVGQTYQAMYTRTWTNHWGQGDGLFESIHQGGIKLWFYQSAASGLNVNIFSSANLGGSGSPSLSPNFRFTFGPPVWRSDGTLATNTGSWWRTQNSFNATTWLDIETIIRCNSLPAGGNDSSGFPTDATFEMWINGTKQNWIFNSTGANVGTTITGFRTRTYRLSQGFRGNWWGVTYGGGQAGSKTRQDFIRHDHHYISVGAAV
jgi:hypothetical protein